MSKGSSEKSTQANTSGWIGSGLRFVSESRAELSKISAPTRQETIQATMIAIVFMAFLAIVLACLDWVLQRLVWQIL